MTPVLDFMLNRLLPEWGSPGRGEGAVSTIRKGRSRGFADVPRDRIAEKTPFTNGADRAITLGDPRTDPREMRALKDISNGGITEVCGMAFGAKLALGRD
jgi:hypothetical protein